MLEFGADAITLGNHVWRRRGPLDRPVPNRDAGAFRDGVEGGPVGGRARRVRGRRSRDELRVRARPGRVTAPPIRYAANGDIHLAYTTLGDGPPDFVLVH